MILDQKHLYPFINQKKFPFILGGGLLLLTIVAMLLINLFSGTADLVFLAGGTELLLYLISNAICSLIVTKFGGYIKKTIIIYILNLLVLFGFSFMLLRRSIFTYPEIFPIYCALIFCFFTSIILVMIIRQVFDVLKD